MKTKILLFGAFVALCLFISCDSNEKTETSSAITNDEITADASIDVAVDDVTAIAEDQYAMQKNASNRTTEGFHSILPACATVTTVKTNTTWTRTIDFGTEGCILHNGNVLKGKIIISASNDFSTLTRSISYSFVGFYHNNKLIEGSKSIEQTLKSTDLLATIHPVSTHSIAMSITFENGKVYTRIGTRVKEMIEGFGTPNIWEDNVFLVWGYHITTFPNGNILTHTITTPLRFVMSCDLPFPVRGVVSITKNDASAIIDFGDGACDDLATITKNGETKEIHLHR